MSTVRTRSRAACFVGAMALLFLFAPVMAAGQDDPDRPVQVTFTKWFITSTLMEGHWGGNLANRYVGELLRRQASVNPALNAASEIDLPPIHPDLVLAERHHDVPAVR